MKISQARNSRIFRPMFFEVKERKELYVVVRGTDEKADWTVSLDAEFADSAIPSSGKIHRGFSSAALCLKKRAIQIIRDHKGHDVIFAGHSLGAAVSACLADSAIARELRIIKTNGRAPDNTYAIITFGAPRIGDLDWCKAIEHLFTSSLIRVVNNNDLVTRIPTRLSGYRHADNVLLYFTEEGKLEIDPTWWQKFTDRVKGAVKDLGEVGLDGVKDHSMKEYLKRVCNTLPLLQDEGEAQTEEPGIDEKTEEE